MDLKEKKEVKQKELQLSFHKNAKPGKALKRKQKAAESQVNKKVKCDTKRTFKDIWKFGRQWLKYDGEKMWCETCKQKKKSQTIFENSNQWTEGTSNFKLDTVTKHEKSQLHRDNTKEAKVKTPEDVKNTEAGKALLQLNKAEYNQVACCFRNVHAIAKHNKSFKDYTWLCQLDKAKGLNVGTTYQNDIACRRFLSHIASGETETTKVLLEKANFFSLTIDGATDISGDEQESIFIHFAQNGKLHQRFVQFVSPKSTTSEHIHKAVIEVFEENLIDKTKLVGVTTDGAANMMGKKKGFTSLLKRQNQDIVVTHCLAHRLELAVKGAVKDLQSKRNDKAMTLLLGLFYFYKKSAKQREGLKQTCQELGVHCVFPTRVGGTRWVPHTILAIETFLRGYKAICGQLDKATAPKASGFSKLAKNVDVLSFIIMLKEILMPVCILSKFLQREDTLLGDAAIMIKSTIETLQSHSVDNSEEINELITSKTYQGIKLGGKMQNMEYRNTLVHAIVKSVESRLISDQELLDATKIANMKTWPPCGAQEQIRMFGVTEVKFLIQRFQHRFQDLTSEILSQWHLLKSLLYNRYGDKVSTLDWMVINQVTFGQGVDKILCLVDLILSLPPTSVFNERSFSHMKLIKTEKRSRLTSETLTELFKVKTLSADIDSFDPTSAIERWITTPGRRRPTFQRSESAGTSSTDAEYNSNENEVDDDDNTEDVHDFNHQPDNDDEETVESDIEQEYEENERKIREYM